MRMVRVGGHLADRAADLADLVVIEAAVGASMMSMPGLCSSTWAMPTRWRQPLERLRMLFSMTACKAHGWTRLALKALAELAGENLDRNPIEARGARVGPARNRHGVSRLYPMDTRAESFRDGDNSRDRRSACSMVRRWVAPPASFRANWR